MKVSPETICIHNVLSGMFTNSIQKYEYEHFNLEKFKKNINEKLIDISICVNKICGFMQTVP